MPHFEHVNVLAVAEVMDGVLTDVVIGVRAMSSRSVIGRRDTYWRVGGVGFASHTVCEIDPGEPTNMSCMLAFEWTQAAPQSFCVNDVAP